MAKMDAPEYASLSPAGKRLVRKIGETSEHMITSESGSAGKAWLDLENQGWVRIRENFHEGYSVSFTLSGWEWWCRQCDAEEGREMTPLQFS